MNVFITGASRGIGAALARAFAQRGATLGLVARQQAALHTLADTLPGQHHRYSLDVTDRHALKQAALDFERATGGADIVIANAGISVGVKTAFEQDLEKFDRVIATNLSAMAYTFHPFIEPMKSRGRGKLVGIASVAGVRGLRGSEAYCASKAGAISYCESLRLDLRAANVRVLTLCPGFVQTDLTAKNPYPMPFMLSADDFAQRAVRAILGRQSYVVIPWPMALVAKALRLLPNWAFDRLFAGRKQKPRDG